jgi:hypothetical protein
MPQSQSSRFAVLFGLPGSPTQEAHEDVQTASQRINQLFIENPKALAMFNELVKELKSPA